MERAEAIAPGDRGGAPIPSLRASRVRVAFALVALVIAAALAAVPLLGADRFSTALMLLGALGLLATAAALLGIPWLLAVTLIALTTEFMVRQLAQSLSAASAIVYGVGLLVLCETVIAATTLPRGAMVERTVAAHRLLGVSYAVVVAAAASAVALLGGSIRVGEAVVAASIGIAAAVGLLTATGLSS